MNHSQSILPKWFTFIYHPKLVHSHLSSPTGSQLSTLLNWFTASYPPKVVQSHLSSKARSQPSTVAKWFINVYHPQLIHRHISSPSGSESSTILSWFTVICHSKLVHSHLLSPSGSESSTIYSWSTGIYPSQLVHSQSPKLPSWFTAALPSRFSLMPCENVGPSNVAPVGPSGGKKHLKDTKYTKRADFWKIKTQISCSVNSVKNSSVCRYYLFLFNDILSASNYVASSHTMINKQIMNWLGCDRNMS